MSNNRICLTKEQFTKLGCDSHAFFEAAVVLESELVSKAHPASTAGRSRATVMMVNFGMGLELKLKSLYYWNNPKHDQGHSFVSLYDNLDRGMKDNLIRLYQEWLSELKNPHTVAAIYKYSKVKPDQILTKYHKLRGLLEFLDDQGLYSRRYSFEKFSSRNWWGVISPKAFSGFVNKVTKFTKTLEEPTFKE